MSVTTLNADAPRYFYHGNLQLPPSMPPHHMKTMDGQYHAATFSMPFPVAADYPLGPVLVPPPIPMYAFLPPPQPVLAGHFLFAPTSLRRSTAPKCLLGNVAPSPPRHCDDAPSPPLPLSSKAAPSSPVPLSSKAVPSPPVPLSSKAVPSRQVPLRSRAVPLSPPTTAPVPSSCEAPKVSALPHGMAPHWFYRWGSVDAEKKQAQAAAMVRAAHAVKPVQEEAPALFPAPAPRPSGRRGQKRGKRTEKRRIRKVWRRQAKAPVELACKPPASSPSPSTVVFTTTPPTPMPAPEWGEEQVTTVMIRNIPNRLKPGEMMQLLDDHCARANGEREGEPADYDFLYLPMDFSLCSNLGYAFVNLTTPEAARGLHYALHGARWTVFGTNKVIDICAARIQGKKALAKHFDRSTFPCHADDFLPAVFSPPRPAAGSVATLVGTRVAPPPTPSPATARAQRLAASKPVARGLRQGCHWVVKSSSRV